MSEQHPLSSVEPLEEALRTVIHKEVGKYVTVTHMGHHHDAWVEVMIPDDVALTEVEVRAYVRAILDAHPEIDRTIPVQVLHTTFD